MKADQKNNNFDLEVGDVTGVSVKDHQTHRLVVGYDANNALFAVAGQYDASKNVDSGKKMSKLKCCNCRLPYG